MFHALLRSGKVPLSLLAQLGLRGDLLPQSLDLFELATDTGNGHRLGRVIPNIQISGATVVMHAHRSRSIQLFVLLDHLLRDLALEVLRGAPRREDALRNILAVVHHSLHLRSVEFTHGVSIVGAQMHTVAEEGRRYDLVVPEFIHCRLAAEAVEGVVRWLILGNQELRVASALPLGLMCAGTPCVDGVAHLTEVTHRIGIGCIDVGTVNHAGLEVLAALNAVVQTDVR